VGPSLHLAGSLHANHTASPLSLLDIPAHERDAEFQRGRHIHGVCASKCELRGQAGGGYRQAFVDGNEPETGQGQEGPHGSHAEASTGGSTRDGAAHLGQRERR